MVARARPPGALDRRLGRPVAGGRARLAGEVWSDAALDAYAELAGKTVKQAQQQIVELLRESGDLVGDPKPITHAVKFYEKGDRPLEIVTTRQWYLTNGGRDPDLRGRASSAWSRAQLAPAAHEGALRALGRRPQRRLADQPPALLRRAVPGLVPPRRGGRPRLRRPPDTHRGRAAGRPVERRPHRLHRRPAWQGGWLHGRPRCHGHVGHVVAHPADRVRTVGAASADGENAKSKPNASRSLLAVA